MLLAAVEPNLERHYNDLLKVISEIGRDVKPAYTNNKVSTDRLRKSTFHHNYFIDHNWHNVGRLDVSRDGLDTLICIKMYHNILSL